MAAILMLQASRQGGPEVKDAPDPRLSKPETASSSPIGGRVEAPLTRRVETPGFGNLSSTAKTENLRKRFTSLRSDLATSADPASILTDLWRDLKGLDAFGQMAFRSVVENELAKLDDGSPAKFEWLASIYPKIASSLEANSYDGQTSRQHLFDMLVANAANAGIDPYQEALKIQDPDARDALVCGVLPEKIITPDDLSRYQGIIDALPAGSKTKTYQGILDNSVFDDAYRSVAIDVYLQGLGSTGLQSNVASHWFADVDWFSKKSGEVSQIIERSKAGPRRDLLLEKMAMLIVRSDPDAARQWVGLISDPTTASRVKSQLPQ
ncbi:hypothetical protein [Luteolibacter sp. LG18]|uniref:hypothetical protein n=1 Tax=Luteolibacter sp. LG18 TaxID=2819286 RepID=UPI0030C680F2